VEEIKYDRKNVRDKNGEKIINKPVLLILDDLIGA
tara:strand:- start:277 stop:381 length:105 start_codon:yes stop_codon:yes gene_type:complete